VQVHQQVGARHNPFHQGVCDPLREGAAGIAGEDARQVQAVDRAGPGPRGEGGRIGDRHAQHRPVERPGIEGGEHLDHCARPLVLVAMDPGGDHQARPRAPADRRDQW
jgi:hypothetical protein